MLMQYQKELHEVQRTVSGRIYDQRITLRVPWREDPERTFFVHLRFDDSCHNGHESFAATCDYPNGGGAAHEEIVRHVPELEPYLKWHGCSTEGPMHYVANTLWFAGDRDCWGLREGERRQIRNGRTGLPAWKLSEVDLPKYVDAEERPSEERVVRYVPWESVGEGKEREFDAARRCAVWPHATDAELSLPREELTVLLENRLPDLLAQFRRAMIELGFEYPEAAA